MAIMLERKVHWSTFADFPARGLHSFTTVETVASRNHPVERMVTPLMHELESTSVIYFLKFTQHITEFSSDEKNSYICCLGLAGVGGGQKNHRAQNSAVVESEIDSCPMGYRAGSKTVAK